jgi:glucose dehydrogenase
MTRQRAPQSSGVLATAGGVVFAGALDRVFAAYDDASGRELWRVRLNDVPNSAPICLRSSHSRRRFMAARHPMCPWLYTCSVGACSTAPSTH